MLHVSVTRLTIWQLILPSCQFTKLPVPGSHTSQLFMLLLIRTRLPSCFHSEKLTALKSVSFNGGVVEMGTSTFDVTGQFGLGVIAFDLLLNLEYFVNV